MGLKRLNGPTHNPNSEIKIGGSHEQYGTNADSGTWS
jgi:hypothetical protein